MSRCGSTSSSSSEAPPPRYPVEIPSAAYYRDLIPCRAACPVGTDAGGYVRAIAEGRYEEAYRIAAENNPLASVCGRICAHPCEAACRRDAIDGAVAIRALKRFAAERAGIDRAGVSGRAHPPEGAPRVAIIGAGPAGIGCADLLGRHGVDVTMFEAARVPGGMLMLGIPEYRLPRDVVRMEIYRVLSRGVDLRTGWALGRDFSVRDLLADGYQAVFVAIGAGTGQSMQIEGRDLEGVIDGIEFLLNVNQGYRVEMGRRVAIIGGGNVAMDAARTAVRTPDASELDTRGKTIVDAARAALRVGAREVHVFAAESRAELPAWGDEIAQAEQEGIAIHTSLAPLAFCGSDGKLRELRTRSVGGSGDRTWQVDTVVTCVGQRVDTGLIDRAVDVELSDVGTIAVDRETLMTSNPRVFAGGDVAFGPRIAIDAVADGLRAGRSILRLLGRGERRSSKLTLVPTCWDRSREPFEQIPRVDPPMIATGRRSGFREVESCYSEELAVEQASRCVFCHVVTVFDADRCVGCGLCVDVCPERALRIVGADSITGPGVPAAIAAQPGSETGLAIIEDQERCNRCGLCVPRCPARAISMQAVQEVVDAQ